MEKRPKNIDVGKRDPVQVNSDCNLTGKPYGYENAFMPEPKEDAAHKWTKLIQQAGSIVLLESVKILT